MAGIDEFWWHKMYGRYILYRRKDGEESQYMIGWDKTDDGPDLFWKRLSTLVYGKVTTFQSEHRLIQLLDEWKNAHPDKYEGWEYIVEQIS